MKVSVEIPGGEDCFDRGVQCPLLFVMPGMIAKCQHYKEILEEDYCHAAYFKCEKCLQAQAADTDKETSKQ